MCRHVKTSSVCVSGLSSHFLSMWRLLARLQELNAHSTNGSSNDSKKINIWQMHITKWDKYCFCLSVRGIVFGISNWICGVNMCYLKSWDSEGLDCFVFATISTDSFLSFSVVDSLELNLDVLDSFAIVISIWIGMETVLQLELVCCFVVFDKPVEFGFISIIRFIICWTNLDLPPDISSGNKYTKPKSIFIFICLMKADQSYKFWKDFVSVHLFRVSTKNPMENKS